MIQGRFQGGSGEVGDRGWSQDEVFKGRGSRGESAISATVTAGNPPERTQH